MRGRASAVEHRGVRSRRRWRAPVLAAVVLCVALASVGVPGMASNATTEDEIRSLDAREAAAMRAADVSALEQLWSSGFVVNAPDGKVKSRDEVLSSVREGRIRYSAFDRTVERIVFRGDCAISMGGELVVPTGDRPDAGRKTPRRYSHVWQKSDGGWVLVARHANVSRPSE